MSVNRAKPASVAPAPRVVTPIDADCDHFVAAHERASHKERIRRLESNYLEAAYDRDLSAGSLSPAVKLAELKRTKTLFGAGLRKIDGMFGLAGEEFTVSDVLGLSKYNWFGGDGVDAEGNEFTRSAPTVRDRIRAYFVPQDELFRDEEQLSLVSKLLEQHTNLANYSVNDFYAFCHAKRHTAHPLLRTTIRWIEMSFLTEETFTDVETLMAFQTFWAKMVDIFEPLQADEARRQPPAGEEDDPKWANVGRPKYVRLPGEEALPPRKIPKPFSSMAAARECFAEEIEIIARKLPLGQAEALTQLDPFANLVTLEERIAKETEAWRGMTPRERRAPPGPSLRGGGGARFRAQLDAEAKAAEAELHGASKGKCAKGKCARAADVDPKDSRLFFYCALAEWGLKGYRSAARLCMTGEEHLFGLCRTSEEGARMEQWLCDQGLDVANLREAREGYYSDECRHLFGRRVPPRPDEARDPAGAEDWDRALGKLWRRARPDGDGWRTLERKMHFCLALADNPLPQRWRLPSFAKLREKRDPMLLSNYETARQAFLGSHAQRCLRARWFLLMSPLERELTHIRSIKTFQATVSSKLLALGLSVAIALFNQLFRWFSEEVL
jgi:hypothetical protein